jgi:hypothetical protein
MPSKNSFNLVWRLQKCQPGTAGNKLCNKHPTWNSARSSGSTAKVKVKCASPFTPRKHTGGAQAALLIINLGTRQQWVASFMPQPLYPWKRAACPYRTGQWAPEPVWVLWKAKEFTVPAGNPLLNFISQVKHQHSPYLTNYMEQSPCWEAKTS